MDNSGRRGAMLEERRKRRSTGSRLGELGERVTRAFSPAVRIEDEHEQDTDNNGYANGSPNELPWEDTLPRFPITRQGYDCAAVEEHISELERELGDLERELAETKSQESSRDEVATEIERIGEQTTAILVAAHDQAQQTTRLAQEQAERCVSDAAANAVAITEEANRRLHDIECETTCLRHEHARLVKEIHSLAGTIRSVADAAAGRVAPEAEKLSGHDVAARLTPEPERSPADEDPTMSVEPID
jgi:hypothetical protein